MEFNREFIPCYGTSVPIMPLVSRITAPNPSPFTFHGTNSYLIGKETLAIIDPGPDNDDQLQSLMAAIDGRPVSHILVTHTHSDHSPLAIRLAQQTGGLITGYVAQPQLDKTADTRLLLDASADKSFSPDIILTDNMVIENNDWSLRTIHTPGHASDHCSFALENTGITFSGDHVMAWATTVVSPPDGNMSAYMASLDKLIERNDKLLLPGHGGPVRHPARFMRGLKAHRKMRERAILERILEGDRTIEDIVSAIYRDTDPKLLKAAGSSVFAHLEDLLERKLITAESPITVQSAFYPA